MNLKTEFVAAECDKFRRECNFTPDERSVFDLRVQGHSIIEIQMLLHISESTVNRRLRAVKRKIYKVL